MKNIKTISLFIAGVLVCIAMLVVFGPITHATTCDHASFMNRDAFSDVRMNVYRGQTITISNDKAARLVSQCAGKYHFPTRPGYTMERQGDNFVITESASDSVWASVAARPGSVTTRVKISVQWIDSDTSRAYADSFWYILVLTPGDSDVPSDDPDTPIRRSVGGGENLPLPGLSLTLSLDAVFDGIDTAEYTPIFEEITRDEEMDVIVQPIQSELVFSTDNQFNDFYAPDLSEVFGS